MTNRDNIVHDVLAQGNAFEGDRPKPIPTTMWAIIKDNHARRRAELEAIRLRLESVPDAAMVEIGKRLKPEEDWTREELDDCFGENFSREEWREIVLRELSLLDGIEAELEKLSH